MRDFVEACAALDSERDFNIIREQSVVMIGKFFDAESMYDIKMALAGSLHYIALGMKVINIPLNNIKPAEMEIANARDTLICAWGRTCPPNFRLLMLYSATYSLIRAYELDFDEVKLFWLMKLKTL